MAKCKVCALSWHLFITRKPIIESRIESIAYTDFTFTAYLNEHSTGHKQRLFHFESFKIRNLH